MANIWGKIKMLLQFCSITLLMLGLTLQVQGLIEIGQVVLIVSTAFALVAAITYSL
jgi:phosphatidylglycerophosphate synthase